MAQMAVALRRGDFGWCKRLIRHGACRNIRFHDQHEPLGPGAIGSMSSSPQIRTTFAWRLAGFYAALFAALGVQVPFLPVWLAAKGFDAREIGIVLAIPMIVRVFAIPVAAHAADRHDALRAAIVITAATAVAGYGAVALASGPLAIMAAFAIASAFYTPLMTLADAYAFRGLGQQGRAYGPVRLWGSVAFIGGSFGAGFLLDAIAPDDLIWLIVVAMGLTMGAACALAPLRPSGRGAPPASLSTNELWRDPTFFGVAAAASLIQASHAVFYGFSTLDWQAAGLDGVTIGALWALGVLAEIVLFAVSGRLPIRPTTLLLTGAAGARGALGRDGIRSAVGSVGATAMPARALVRRHPPRRAWAHRASGTRPFGSNRARSSRGRPRARDGGSDGAIGLALWPLRQPRLLGDGGHGRRRRLGCARRPSALAPGGVACRR